MIHIKNWKNGRWSPYLTPPLHWNIEISLIIVERFWLIYLRPRGPRVYCTHNLISRQVYALELSIQFSAESESGNCWSWTVFCCLCWQFVWLVWFISVPWQKFITTICIWICGWMFDVMLSLNGFHFLHSFQSYKLHNESKQSKRIM